MRGRSAPVVGGGATQSEKKKQHMAVYNQVGSCQPSLGIKNPSNKTSTSYKMGAYYIYLNIYRYLVIHEVITPYKLALQMGNCGFFTPINGVKWAST